jgi:hypothetical protein
MANLRTATTLDVRTMGGIFGRGRIQATGAGVFNAASQCSIFLDALGATPGTSNVEAPGVTTSDANFFNGRCPNQEIFTLWGMQIALQEQDANGVAIQAASAVIDTGINLAGVQQEALKSCSLELSLKGSNYSIGSLMNMPSPAGANGVTQNGGRAVAPFRFPRQLPLQLEGNDQFFVTIKTTRAFAASAAAAHFMSFYIYCPASRGHSR